MIIIIIILLCCNATVCWCAWVCVCTSDLLRMEVEMIIIISLVFVL